MKPSDLPLLISAGRPAPLPDGRVLLARSHPDLESDRTESQLVLVDADGTERVFTHGPRDSAPVLSPDGRRVVFSRAGESGPPQLYDIPIDGGEARRLTDHPLGASQPVFSPDSSTLAYLAAVPEPGRYGTDDDISADAEAPRRIVELAYRRDGKGFTLDRPEQIYLLDLERDGADSHADSPAGSPAGANSADSADGREPRRLTDEFRGAGRPAFLSDGSAVVYARAAGTMDLPNELVVAPVDPAGTDPVTDPRVLVSGIGGVGLPVVVPAAGSASGDDAGANSTDLVYFGADVFSGIDFAGRNTGLFVVPAAGGTARRLTDEQTVQLADATPVAVGDHLLVTVENRGAVELLAVPADADKAPLDDLPVLIGGSRVVRSFAVLNGRLAAVVGDPTSFAELVLADLTDEKSGGAGLAGEQIVTGWGAGLRAAGLAEMIELSGPGADGYPIHGWLVLPEGSGPHPVLLNVHGGPHAAYGWSVFDEAQVYADAGYAVVMGNPRGSSGYGQDHGRAIVGAMGTVDADDVLALLDLALQRDDLDGDRVGVMGGSYGGFMTGWLASHAPGRFVAGISERAVNAWDSFAGASDIGYFFAEGYVGADRDTQWDRSPLAHADKIDIPLLIIHSEQDWRCPLEQAQRLFVALKLRGAETEMLLFPAEGHELSRGGRPRHRQQRFDAILDWWKRHLPTS